MLAFRTRARLLASGFALAVLAACNDSGGATPTTPDSGPPATGASIAGEVFVGDAPAAGYEVTTDGATFRAITDESGSFALDAVPAGDRVVRFARGARTASIVLDQVEPAETIRLSVAVAGSRAEIRSLTRSSGRGGRDGGDDGDDDEEDVPEGPLAFSIQPGEWSVCSTPSRGQLTVFLRGDGYDLVDPASLLLAGDDVAAAPIAPIRASREGHHVKAKFSKAEAWTLLLEPIEPDVERTLRLDFSLDGVPTSLVDTVLLVACDDEDEEEDEDEE
jgi:hypothetical protein